MFDIDTSIFCLFSLYLCAYSVVLCYNNNNNYYYYNHFTTPGLCPGLPMWAGTRKVKPIWIYWSKRWWLAVASAVPYADHHKSSQKSFGNSYITTPHDREWTRPLYVLAVQNAHCGQIQSLNCWYTTSTTHRWTHKDSIYHANIAHTRTTQPFCPGQPGWPGTRRNIHPLTLIVVINHLYLLSPSTTIHGILPIQSTCCTVFFHNLSPIFRSSPQRWPNKPSKSVRPSVHTYVRTSVRPYVRPYVMFRGKSRDYQNCSVYIVYWSCAQS